MRGSLPLELFEHGWVIGAPVDKDMIDADLYEGVQEKGGRC